MVFVIEVSDLSKSFGSVKALEGVSFSVPEGIIFGLLGPNGVGKTTIVRLLNGVLKPDFGTANVLGKDVQTEGSVVRQFTGVQTDTNLYEQLSGHENLRIWGKLYGLSDNQIKNRIEALLNEFGLSDRQNHLVGTYSKGMKQKLSICRALIHEPKILFLDEPTAGLDPESSNELLDFLKRSVAAKQRTVFLCSHRLEEVEQVCDAVAIIHRGHVLEQGKVSDLSKRFWKKTVFLVSGQGFEKLKSDFLKKINGRLIDGRLRIEVDRSSDIAAVIESLVASKVKIFEVIEERHSLKDVYFEVMGGAKK